MTAGEELRENYWRIIRRTRKSGRISQSVIDKEEAYWRQFSNDVVENALRIHISRYPSYKECYTRGIMRNLAKAAGTHRPTEARNSFCQFPQREYDFDELEKLLVNNI